MKKLHKRAKAYYKAASETTKVEAQSLFNNMDTDGDGEVSFSEFKNYLKGGDQDQMKKYFNVADTDKSGELDFWEAVTFYYLLNGGAVECDKCEAILVERYFTCVTCYNDTNTDGSFDLCEHCYKTDRNHQHDNFSHIKSLLKSNHPQVLHRSKRAIAAKLIGRLVVGTAARIGISTVGSGGDIDLSGLVDVAGEIGLEVVSSVCSVM